MRMLNKKCFGALLGALFGVLVGITVANAQTAPNGVVYVDGIDDLPLMDGLQLDDSASFVYDKAEGRIVGVTAQGIIPASDIKTFYEKTLNELGWKKDQNGVYTRENEKLEITLLKNKKGNKIVVNFYLAPKNLD